MRVPAVVAAALALMAAAEPPKQFDLVCSGAAVTDDASGAFDHDDVRLRIDLAKNKWCEDPPATYSGPIGPCAALHDIAEVQPGVIWLEKENDEEEARGIMHSRAVNRQTGDYLYLEDFKSLGRVRRIAVKSHCELAPFSGFPKIETKF